MLRTYNLTRKPNARTSINICLHSTETFKTVADIAKTSDFRTLTNPATELEGLKLNIMFPADTYEIIERLGDTTWRAKDVPLDRVVAIKCLPPAIAADEEKLKNFRQCGRILGCLDHPNIVRLINVDQHEGWEYMVMQYIDGIPLSEWQSDDSNSLMAIQAQIENAKQYAVDHGVENLDPAPNNVLVDDAGRAIITVAAFASCRAFDI